jgi:hypothetical protein
VYIARLTGRGAAYQPSIKHRMSITISDDVATLIVEQAIPLEYIEMFCSTKSVNPLYLDPNRS